MSIPKGDNRQNPARGTHLHVLTMNSNTVRHPPQGLDGRLITWQRPGGKQCEAKFQFEEPELDPEVWNGERIEWINPTKQACTITFDPSEVAVPPFEDKARTFTVNPGHSVFSGVVKGNEGKRYSYLVNFADDDGGEQGNPVIIIR